MSAIEVRGSAAGYVSVALPLPIRKEFDYRIPERFRQRVEPGQRVRAPFGGRSLVGFAIAIREEPEIDVERVKEIRDLVDATPVVGPELLGLARWIAQYYHTSLGEALAAILPAAVGRERPRMARVVSLALAGDELEEAIQSASDRWPARTRILRALSANGGPMELSELLARTGTTASPVRTLAKARVVSIERVPVKIDRAAEPTEISGEPPPLSREQARALDEIGRAAGPDEFRVNLLWGVTGSGKTEVYIRAIEAVVARGEQAIVLVPEISLTPQTLRRFRARFARVALLHSGLTDVERRDEWERIARGRADLVIGPRSAVFAPVPRLGLIVLDEEHEPSFKQNATPRYHAREVAIMRAYFAKRPVILGSATPSLESFANAAKGKFGLAVLSRRIASRRLPEVMVVDMAREERPGKKSQVLSEPLVRLVRAALDRKEQVILLRNRRGHSTVLVCPACGHVVRCKRCDVSLTWHAAFKRALCHYCNHEESAGTTCPECLSGRLAYLGTGTERVEEILGLVFEGARIARMDSDTMVSRGAYERTLGAFERGESDVLVGTQMIGKGLDFPRVTVVGVLSADSVLHLPDFRSAERTFQLVTQVAGRAGRGDLPGKVVVQTRLADHYAIQTASQHDYRGFAERDLEARRALGYPPFGRLVRFVASGPEESRVRDKMREFARGLEEPVGKAKGQLLGPAPCYLHRLEDRFRWNVLVKAPRPGDLTRILSAIEPSPARRGASRAVQMTVDVDPTDML